MPFKVHDSFGQKRAWATSKMQFGLCKAQELGFFFFNEKHEMAKQTVSVNTIRLVSRRHSLVLEKAYLVQQPDSLDWTFSIPLVTTPAKL